MTQYANKIIHKESSSRHGWFKRDRSRHRPPTRSGRRLSCVHLFKFRGKGPQLVSEIESTGGKALSLKADSASAKELRAAVARTAEAFGTSRYLRQQRWHSHEGHNRYL